MAGITNYGFETKTFNQIKTELEQEFRKLLGEDINLESSSAIGQIIGLSSLFQSNLWELSQSVYNSRFLENASGINLDNMVAMAGLLRRAGVRTSGQVYLVGTPRSIVPEGTQFRSSTGVIYETLNITALSDGVAPILRISKIPDQSDNIFIRPVTDLFGQFPIPENPLVFHWTNSLNSILDSFNNYFAGIQGQSSPIVSTVERNGEDLIVTFDKNVFLPAFRSPQAIIEQTRIGTRDGIGVTISNVVEGAVLTTAGQVTEILTPTEGLTEVINFDNFITGRDPESDEDLRNRFLRRVSTAQTSTKDSIERELLLLNGVSQAVVFEGTENSENIKLGQIEVLVLGGEDDEIAQSIFINKSLVETIGNTQAIARDRNGEAYAIRFSRPEFVNFDIRIDLVRSTAFPSGGIDEIVRLIGEVQSEFKFGSNFAPSPDLVYPLRNIQGIESVQISVSLQGENQFNENLRTLLAHQIPNFSSISVYENGVKL